MSFRKQANVGDHWKYQNYCLYPITWTTLKTAKYKIVMAMDRK